MAQITFKIPGRDDAVLGPGDSLDLWPDGALRWLTEEEAKKWREERDRRNQQRSDWVGTAKVQRGD